VSTSDHYEGPSFRLGALPEGERGGEDDGERAIHLLADVAAMEEWLVFETQPIAGHVSGLERMSSQVRPVATGSDGSSTSQTGPV
jgi:hypothetical protein